MLRQAHTTRIYSRVTGVQSKLGRNVLGRCAAKNIIKALPHPPLDLPPLSLPRWTQAPTRIQQKKHIWFTPSRHIDVTHLRQIFRRQHIIGSSVAAAAAKSGSEAVSQGVVAKSPDLATAATTGAEAASVAATAASTTTTSVVATAAAETAATVGFWASLHYWQKFTTMNPSILSAIYLYPLTFIEAVIEAFQVWTGLPWWQVICFYAFTARALGLPFLIRQVTYATKMEKLRPHLNALRERHMAKMSAAMAAGRPGPNYLDFQREQKLILAREGIGTFEMFKNAVFQVLPLVVFVAALSRMARFDIFEPLRTGGVLYFVDLTAQDPYSIFPLLSVASTILIFELSSTAPHEARTLQRIIAGVVGCFTFFWTSYFPMAIHLFWTVTNMFVMAVHFLLRFPRVRKFFHVPLRPQDEIRPDNVVTFDNKVVSHTTSTLPNKSSKAPNEFSTASTLLSRKRNKKL